MDCYALTKALGKAPKNAECVKPPVDECDFPKVQDSHTFYKAAEDAEKIREYSEIMARNRLHYIRQMENAERNKKIIEQTRERKDLVKRVMTRADAGKWKSLLKDRHTWRKAAAEFSPSNPRVCAYPTCAAQPMECSLFCFHHILMDPKQVLFIECKQCGRPYPRAGSCVMCHLRT